MKLKGIYLLTFSLLCFSMAVSQNTSLRIAHTDSVEHVGKSLVNLLLEAIRKENITLINWLATGRQVDTERWALLFERSKRRKEILLSSSGGNPSSNGLIDLSLDISRIRLSKDTMVAVVSAKLKAEKKKDHSHGASLPLLLTREGNTWRFSSYAGLLDSLAKIVDNSLDGGSNSRTESIQRTAAAQSSTVITSSVQWTFTDRTLSWDAIPGSPFGPDRDGDGIMTQNDLVSYFGTSSIYSPVDGAVVSYSSGENVGFVIDEAGFIDYLSTSDNAMRYFDPGATSLGAFNLPKAIVADITGNVYVADTYNNRIIKLHYNSSSKTFDSYSVLSNQLNLPYDIDIHYGSNLSDPNDDYIIVANSGEKNILILSASSGSIIYQVNSYMLGNGSSVNFVFPSSVAITRWTSTLNSSFTRIFVLDGDESQSSILEFMPYYDPGYGGTPGYPPVTLPSESSPSKIMLDVFDAWSCPNLWVLDELNGQVHKFTASYGYLTYLCSFGSNGFLWNQFNGIQTKGYVQNYNSSTIYLDVFTLDRLTNRTGGRTWVDGSEIRDFTYVPFGNTLVDFNFTSIGNYGYHLATVKNSSGQVIWTNSGYHYNIAATAGPKSIRWVTNGSYGNFTVELYVSIPGGYSSDFKTFGIYIPPPPLAVTMSGPSGVYHPGKGETNQYTWTANVSGGAPPYTYAWKKNGVPVGSNSSTYTEYLSFNGWNCGSYNFSLRCDVTGGGSVYATKNVTAWNSCGGSGGAEKPPGILAEIIPTEYSINQNYPNPFNPETEISFGLPEPSQVRITISDMLGRRIVTLAEGQFSAGFHRFRWNAINEAGNKVSSGIYFYRIIAKGESGKQFAKVMKMNVTK